MLIFYIPATMIPNLLRDGNVWSGGTITGPGSSQLFHAVAYSPSLNLAVTVDSLSPGGYATSTDGINWVKGNNGLGTLLEHIEWDPINQVFLAGGLLETFVSFDGTVWTDLDLTGTLNAMNVESIIITSSSSPSVSRQSFSEFDGDPQVMMSVSPDTKTTGFTEPRRSMGKKGEYSKRLVWNRLGQYGSATRRSFNPIVKISDPVKRAVFQAYIEIEICDR